MYIYSVIIKGHMKIEVDLYLKYSKNWMKWHFIISFIVLTDIFLSKKEYIYNSNNIIVIVQPILINGLLYRY